MIQKEVLEKMKNKIFEAPEPVLTTNFRDLDNALSGLEKGSLITIGGRPAMGKTAFITSLMINLLEQAKKCLLFSIEMSEEQILKRFISSIAEVDSHTLINFSKNIRPEVKNKMTYAISKIEKYDLTIFDEMTNIETIKEQIETVKPEFIFIDYLQLISNFGKKSRTDFIEDVMKNLKTIAKENNCIIFITSQLSRAVESRYGRRPLLSNLRESGSIENLSDVVMFIYRSDYYGDYDEDYAYNKGKAEIMIAKNSFGPTCLVELLFRSSIMKFLEPIHCDEF